MTDLQGKKEHGKPLTGAALKNIAYISMGIDHFFAILFLNYMSVHLVDGGWDPKLELIYRAGRAVGRIAFVLFAFLIVEGFLYTRSRARFLLRLFLFALLSEIPFDLAFSESGINWTSQNVYWTLLLGVIVLMVWEYLSHYRSVLPMIGRILIVTAACTTAFCAGTDYRFMGVLLILTFYLTREKNGSVRFMAVGVVMFLGTWGNNLIRYAGNYEVYDLFSATLPVALRELYGLAALLPIYLYNGKRGKQLPKLFYYGFYPAHLLLLYRIAQVMGFYVNQ